MKRKAGTRPGVVVLPEGHAPSSDLVEQGAFILHVPARDPNKPRPDLTIVRKRRGGKLVYSVGIADFESLREFHEVIRNERSGARMRAKNRAAAQKRWHGLSRQDASLWREAARYRRAHPDASTRDVAAAVKSAIPEDPRAAETIRARLRILGGRVNAFLKTMGK